MLFHILAGAFGLYGLIRGEFQLTRTRRVYQPHARIIGLILIISAFVSLLSISPIIGMLIATVYGLKVSKPAAKSKNDDRVPRSTNEDFKYKEKRDG